ncbi:MAG TPA: STAS domain-containing protein [Solirubrobacterales bacterium]|nr:STAS domain-containing protein [Solirubrobacterales bacterium]
MDAGEIVSERTEPGVAVITFSGEHDLNTAPDLRQKLGAEIEDGCAIVVDLSGAAFIDSSILGAMLDARRRARDAGIGFEVALNDGAQPVERVLDVTGLRSSLPVHSTRAAAIEAVRTGPSGE